MQNRGTIGIFTVLLILTALYMLSFSYFTGKFEEKALTEATAQFEALPNAADFSEDDKNKEIKRLSRMYLRENGDEAIYPVFNKTYDEIKEKELRPKEPYPPNLSITRRINTKK